MGSHALIQQFKTTLLNLAQEKQCLSSTHPITLISLEIPPSLCLYYDLIAEKKKKKPEFDSY